MIYSIRGISAGSICTVMPMDTLRCIVEGGCPFPCGRHGSFDRQPIGGRTRNRSRQPIEFWRQRVRQMAVRTLRRERSKYKADWRQYSFGTYAADVF